MRVQNREHRAAAGGDRELQALADKEAVGAAGWKTRLCEIGHRASGKQAATGKLISREGTPEEKVTGGDKSSRLWKSWGGLSALGPSKMHVQN